MWLGAQTVNCNSYYREQIVSAFIIENHGEVKEKFSYEILFNKTTQQSLVAYSHANYGPEAVFRHMTGEEEAEFIVASSGFHFRTIVSEKSSSPPSRVHSGFL